ncbi:GDSL-type esterase/lipase family protein [Chloroflexota bacterium]
MRKAFRKPVPGSAQGPVPGAVRGLAIVLAAIWGLVSAFPVASQSNGATQSPFRVQEVRFLEVARDSSGVLWAVWEMDTGRDAEIYFSRWTGGGWLPPQPVHNRPQAWDRSPDLVVGAGGKPWVAWSSTERSDPHKARVYVSRWTGGRWSAPEAVPLGSVSVENCPQCGVAKEPALAAAPDGVLWLAWVGFDGTDDEIFAQTWDGGSWSTPVQVSADDDDPTLYDRQPSLAVGADGEPWLAWTGHQYGADDEIFASHWTGTGWAEERMVSADDGAVDAEPSVALNALGQPWVAWQGRMDDDQYQRRRIMFSRWAIPGSDWTAEEFAASPSGSGPDEVSATLSLDEMGTLRLAWVTLSDAGSVLTHSKWQESQWAEPRLVQAQVPEQRASWAAELEGAPALLWLEPAAPEGVPLESSTVKDTSPPLSRWLDDRQVPDQQGGNSIQSTPFSHRHLAFGDSITWGQYPASDPFTPYSTRLEATLDATVADSYVINSGWPSEGTEKGANRIKLEVQASRPKYVEIMEGTNDVSKQKTPEQVKENLLLMLANAKVHAGVDDVEALLATIIPRLDDRNDETQEMNEQAVIPAAQQRHVPICDMWQAFYDYGPWQTMYWDEKHPNQSGLNLMADVYFDCAVTYFPGVVPETTPPTTWVNPLPAQYECGNVQVSWDGTDNMSWVVDYDLQARVNGGPWTNWLMGTTETSGIYGGGSHGDTVGFHVRGRDRAGNESTWSSEESTQILDTEPPDAAGVHDLPPAQTAPFLVDWWATDACSDIVAYRVQVKVGASGTWQDWLPETPNGYGMFDPSSPVYGETYYFRVKAKDEAGLWSANWSASASTVLARYSLSGQILTIRDEPVAFPEADITPAPLYLETWFGGYRGHLATGGNHDVEASRYGFGTLPPMHLSVGSSTENLDFFLPPADDAVTDGGFETGGLTNWQTGGSLVPSVTGLAHTGDWAVQLGDSSETSSLSQEMSPGANLVRPTLSYLARLETGTSASTLEVQIEVDGAPGATQTFVVPVTSAAWAHVWHDLADLPTGTWTVSFAVENAPTVVLDEVSVGSAHAGGGKAYMPFIAR